MDVIVTTPAALRELVAEAVADALSELAPTPPDVQPLLVDTSTICRLIGVSRPTLRKLQSQGLPTVWVCDAPRFEPAAVLAWLRTRKRGAAR